MSEGSRLDPGAGRGWPSFDPAFFPRLAALEDRHFWFRARNLVISGVLRRLAEGLPPDGRVLEMGCGGGNVLREMEKAFPRGTVIGLDLFMEGLRFARRRTSCHLVRGDIAAPPFSPGFHLIGLFDVLEHLPDDGATLTAIRGLLAPDGALVLTVPAHESLWSRFDEVSGHKRRYSRASLAAKLSSAGYRVEYETFFMCATLPFIRLARRFSGRASKPGSDELASGGLRLVPVANGILFRLLSWEAPLIAGGRSLPGGSSLLAVARPGAGGS